jgi:hypothetical protein
MDILASRAQLRLFLTERRATLARLRRANEALRRWDVINAAAEMPEDLGPPPVEQPSVSWASLKELQGMLGDGLGELESAWERRHQPMLRLGL